MVSPWFSCAKTADISASLVGSELNGTAAWEMAGASGGCGGSGEDDDGVPSTPAANVLFSVRVSLLISSGVP